VSSDDPEVAGLKSGDVRGELAGVLNRGGLAAIHARGDRLEIGGEHRCGECVSRGHYPKRLLSSIKIDSSHASQGKPDMVMSAPALPSAQCDCGRTYFVEPKEDDQP
jgi:hypothetical protein